MACNCIEQIEEKLRKATGDDEAFLSTTLDIEKRIRVFNAKGYYRGKLLGKFKKNFLLSYIAFTHCPFCGKKYIEEVKNDSSI
jgi:hypothetical protein